MTISVWSQELPFLFKGKVTNQDIGASEGGVTVAVIQNGTSVLSTVTASSGKYTLRGNINYKSAFDVVFSKNGLVSKRVHFDLSKMNEEDAPPGEVKPIEDLSIDMFKVRENIDFSFLDTEPVADFKWSTRQMAAANDAAASEQMKAKINNLLSKEENDKAKNDAAYQEAMFQADAAYDSKEYQKALDKYKEATGYKPEEQRPKDRIIELEALVKAQKAEQDAANALNDKYDKLIAEADKLNYAGKYEDAIDKYEDAIFVKDEVYPNDQVTLLMSRIALAKKEAESNQGYDAAVSSGESFLKQNSLKAAKDNFTIANKLKPTEPLPIAKLKEIEKLLKAAESAEAEKKLYDDAIVAGDAFFAAENWSSAKEKYVVALTYQSGSTYAKERKKACEDNLGLAEAEAAKQKQIQKLLADGNTAMTAKSYQVAITAFQAVLALEPENTIAKEKLVLANQKLEESNSQAAKEVEFKELVALGDAKFTSKNYQESIVKFEAAIALIPSAEVDKKIASAKVKLNEEAELAAKSAEFNKLVEDGNQLIADNKLTEAKTNFEKAKKLDPTSTIPVEKIKEIDALLANEKSVADKLAKYDALIEIANNLFNTEEWAKAEIKYNDALNFTEDKSYAEGRIAEIKLKLASNQAVAQKKAKYDVLITEANSLFNAKKWTNAESKYNEALTFTDDKVYANGKIEEIKLKLAEEQSIADRLAKYDELIDAANSSFGSEKWTDAETKYKEALTYTDSKEYAQGRIDEIQKKLAGNQAEEEKQAKYKELIKVGDGLFGGEKWTEAETKYFEALNYASDKKYAQGKIDEIKVKLNEKKAKDAELAKIAGLLTEGKNLYDAKSLEPARAKYQQVLVIDGLNEEAKAQIDRINADLAAFKNDAEKEIEFKKLKDEGFALAGQKEYSGAKAKLNEALSLKEDAGVRTKIAEIEKLEKEQNALSQKDSEYNNLMGEAGNLGSSGKYPEAIAKYKTALSLKPLEPAPVAKISEMEAKIKEGESQILKDKEYNALMAAGEKLMDAKQYLDAIKEFNAALVVKPMEQAPVDRALEAERLEKESTSELDAALDKNLRIAENKINEGNYARATEILNDTEKTIPGDPRIKALRDQITLFKKQDKEYEEIMKVADGLAASKDYADAKLKYEQASSKKPNLELPKEKIEEMKKLIENQASSAQKNQLYSEYMNDAGKFQDAKEYERALSSYQNALTIKEGDVPATNKINEIQLILDKIANANSADLKKQNEFDELIKKADALFASKSYPKAKGIYDAALAIFPTDGYAKLQAEECERLSRADSLAEEELQYQKIIAVADKNFGDEEYDKAKMRYETALSLRHNDPYPKMKLSEIDAILHPAEVVTVELEDLGTPFSGSILDGTFLLSQAEEERKLINNTGVQNAFDEIKDQESARTIQKTQDHLDNSNRIYQVQMGIIAENGEQDLGRQESLEILRQSEREIEDLRASNQLNEQLGNISDQDLLYTINREVELDYGIRDEVYMDNTGTMQNYKRETSDVNEIMTSVEYASNYAEDHRITEIKKTVQGEMIDDFEDRDAVRQNVEDVKERVSNEFDIATKNNYDNLIDAQDAIDNSQKVYDSKQAVDALGAAENNEELKKIAINIRETSEAKSGIEDNEHYATNAEMDEIKRGYDAKTALDHQSVLENNDELSIIKANIAAKDLIQAEDELDQLQLVDRNMTLIKLEIISDEGERDVNRNETVELLRVGERELAQVQYEAYNAEQAQNYSSQATIQNGVKENGKIYEIAEVAHADNVEGMKIIDKKAQLNTGGIAMSDEEERLNAQKGIGNVYTDAELVAIEDKEKQVKSGQALEGTKRVIDQKNSNQAIGEDDKHYSAADKIHSVNDAPVKKVKEANSIGAEYPEGVSQESFTQNDQNGLMTSIITRRIVVINGHADIYVRTQSLNAITYSKNGSPSLSHVWNSETQGPQLERHY